MRTSTCRLTARTASGVVSSSDRRAKRPAATGELARSTALPHSPGPAPDQGEPFREPTWADFGRQSATPSHCLGCSSAQPALLGDTQRHRECDWGSRGRRFATPAGAVLGSAASALRARQHRCPILGAGWERRGSVRRRQTRLAVLSGLYRPARRSTACALIVEQSLPNTCRNPWRSGIAAQPRAGSIDRLQNGCSAN